MSSDVIHHRCPRCDESIFFDEENQICDKCEWGLDEGHEDETTTEKGNRNENEAKDILKRAYGAGVEKVDAFANHDPFGFVDLIAMQPGERVKFVQVKTNGFTAADRRKYQRQTRKLPPEHAEFEVWVRFDFEGWVLYKYDGKNFEQYAKLPCNESDAGDQYRSLHTDGERQ